MAGHDISPDDGGFRPLGVMMKAYSSKNYYAKTGPMNSYVYPVPGGMEDWAYAASWDTANNQGCHPSSYGGYPRAKTSYTPDMLKAFNILIETSSAKKPSYGFGNTNEVLRGSGASGDGHIPRNLRLCLLMTDLVQPYLVWTDDSGGLRAPALAPATVPPGLTVELGWDVGGALHVDYTQLLVIRWSANECPASTDGVELDDTSPGSIRHDATAAAGASDTIWSRSTDVAPSSDPSADSAGWSPYETRYSAAHTFGSEPGMYVVIAVAGVDAEWARTGTRKHFPAVKPQSHVVRARTEQDYSASNNGHVIKGRTEWHSVPRCFRVSVKETESEAEDKTTPREVETAALEAVTSESVHITTTTKVNTDLFNGGSDVLGASTTAKVSVSRTLTLTSTRMTETEAATALTGATTTAPPSKISGIPGVSAIANASGLDPTAVVALGLGVTVLVIAVAVVFIRRRSMDWKNLSVFSRKGSMATYSELLHDAEGGGQDGDDDSVDDLQFFLPQSSV